MKWRVGDKYFIESDQGYKVCKVCVNDVWQYVAWRPKGGRYVELGQCSNSDEAKQLCEDDFKTRDGETASELSGAPVVSGNNDSEGDVDAAA